MTARLRYALVVLALLPLVMAAVAIVFTVTYYHAEQAAQRRQGQVLELKLCTTLGRLAALTPPAGSPAANPSRAFEQKLTSTLAELGPDVGCK